MRCNLIHVCKNLEHVVKKQLITNNQVLKKKDFQPYIYNLNNNEIVDYIFKLTEIGKHPELYHLRK